MKITLEMIDQLREHTNVSYREVIKALEQTEGNPDKALILIEKSIADRKIEEKSKSIIDYIIVLFNKLNHINVRFDKNDTIVIKMPALILIIISMILFAFILSGVILIILSFF